MLTALDRSSHRWGSFEWSGDWSDNSDLWTPKMQSLAKFTKEDDGTFWMCWVDFLRYFDEVRVCLRLHNIWRRQL